MKKYIYIVNPVSGKGRGKKVIPLIHSVSKGLGVDYNIIETKGTLDASRIASEYSNDKNIIISVGGDGTLNEVINGIDLNTGITLSVLPVGSGNDFVKNLNYAKNIKDNLSFILQSNHENIINVDVGEVSFTENNDHKTTKYNRFINNLGIGFDAYVGFLNQNNKILSGLTSYILAVIKALFNYNMISIDLESNNSFIKGEKLMISIGNGISSGGGFYLNPNAKVDDGILDLSIFEKITRRRLLSALPMALVNKIEKVPEASLTRTEKIKIELKNPYYMHCDGEIISDNLRTAEIT
ncbi:MAG: YegS/Rv2252/BmrU family lipid kinase, partial [Ignavibacteriae bacterium]|nr:YegS/Rv2252/BmrU family lipid kinase [Ignavibacteriota bacterium]